MLQQLMKLGLVSETRKGIKRAFLAENPQRLVEILQEKESAISSILSELQSLWQISQHGSVEK